MRALFVPVLIVGAASCGDNKDGPIDSATPDTTTLIDAAIDAIPVDAPDPRNATYLLGNSNSANGIYWDATAKKLYLTESNANALLSWTDAAHTFSIHSQFPIPVPATAQVSLGDILPNTDGTFIVSNFFASNLVKAPAAAQSMGSAITVTDGTAMRRRIGLSRNPAGDVYAATFVGGGGMNQTGAITKLTITGATATEEIVVTNIDTSTTFKKLVGIVATNTALWVTQQDGGRLADDVDNALYKVDLPLATPPVVTKIKDTMHYADLLVPLPNGDFLTGCKMAVCRITQAGVETQLTALGTFEDVRGLAYDADMQRLFIINHSNTVTTGDKLEIRPFTP